MSSGKWDNALPSGGIDPLLELPVATALESEDMSKRREQQFAEIFDGDGAGIARIANLYGGNDAQDLYQDISLAIWLA